MIMMKNFSNEEILLSALDQVMRMLRRRPVSNQRFGRGTYRLLSAIYMHSEIATRELAETLNLRPSSLNERLVKLESEEIIERYKNPLDQRIYLVKLTSKGTEFLNELKDEREKLNEKIGDILEENEIEKLTLLANKLGNGLSQLSMESESSHNS